MAWYRAGTCSVTNGSQAVTGAGTAWVANAQAGDAIKGPDEKLYEVQSVGGDGAITLATNYLGTTAAGAAYAIIPTQGRVRDLAAQVLALINDYGAVLTGAGAGKFADGSAGTPGVSFASDPDCGFYRIGANSIGLTTGGVLRVTWDAGGNVGIGGAPSQAFEVRTAAARAAVIPATATNNALFQATNSGGNAFIGLDSSTGGLAAAYALVLYHAGAYPVIIATNNLERMRIDSSGNVGIGTSSPGQRLTVKAAGASYSAGALSLVAGATGNTTYMTNVGGVFFLSNDGSTDHLQIDSSGNQINTPSNTPPSLTANGQINLTPTSNTNARISYRGSDGVTRVGNIPLA
jgi:hypothetical protein